MTDSLYTLTHTPSVSGNGDHKHSFSSSLLFFGLHFTRLTSDEKSEVEDVIRLKIVLSDVIEVKLKTNKIK